MYIEFDIGWLADWSTEITIAVINGEVYAFLADGHLQESERIG